MPAGSQCEKRILRTALLVFWQGFESFGAFVGPLGLAVGVVAGWLTLLLLLALRRGRGGMLPPTGLRPALAGRTLGGAVAGAPGLDGGQGRPGHGHE